VTYAYLTADLDQQRRDEFDRILASAGGDEKAKARRERAAIDALMKLPKA
jgi:hypothetical protein